MQQTCFPARTSATYHVPEKKGTINIFKTHHLDM